MKTSEHDVVITSVNNFKPVTTIVWAHGNPISPERLERERKANEYRAEQLSGR